VGIDGLLVGGASGSARLARPGYTLRSVPSADRWREYLDRLHPAGLLYATYEHRLIAELDPDRLPRHVAVLADGNRRWARTNAPGKPLSAGYRAGAERLRDFVEWCDEIGIPVVTLWVLSTDNYSRASEEEIGPLLEVIEELVDELAGTGRWHVHPVGALDLLPGATADHLRTVDVATSSSDGMMVNVAVSYGGRHELRDAVRSLLARGPDDQVRVRLLDVAVGAQRVLLLRGPVARLPQGRLHPRAPGVRAAGTPVRSLKTRLVPRRGGTCHHRSMSDTIVVGAQGRLVLPAETRRALRLEPGQRLTVTVSGRTVLLQKQEDAVEELRDLGRGLEPHRSLVDELLEERRSAADA
jgi:undecaprenyl diphosphate synthase